MTILRGLDAEIFCICLTHEQHRIIDVFYFYRFSHIFDFLILTSPKIEICQFLITFFNILFLRFWGNNIKDMRKSI